MCSIEPKLFFVGETLALFPPTKENLSSRISACDECSLPIHISCLIFFQLIYTYMHMQVQCWWTGGLSLHPIVIHNIDFCNIQAYFFTGQNLYSATVSTLCESFSR